MSNLPPPVFDFDRLKPVTMTIIVPYDVQELNLPAIFMLLPVTDQTLMAHHTFQRKQGKLKLPPELNIPGQILSMRYDKQVRGIIRSESARSFSHSIIIDVGTSERIVSVKLSRTLELTGPTSMEIAREAAQHVIDHVKRCQASLEFIRAHQEEAIKVRDQCIELISRIRDIVGVEITLKYLNDFAATLNPVQTKIWDFFRHQIKGYSYDRIPDFLNFLIHFGRNLYTGTLTLGHFECEMVNIQFNLGYAINQVAFARVMNNMPFVCNYNNVKSAAAVNVCYYYIKHDRNTGHPKQAKHTIRVNKSGHVRHSGPNLEMMKSVYYAFIQRTLQWYTQVQSAEARQTKHQLRVVNQPKRLSIFEWREFLRQEEDLRQRILRGDVPIATGEQAPPVVKPEPVSIIIIEPSTNNNYSQAPSSERASLPSLTFDYAPVLSVKY